MRRYRYTAFILIIIFAAVSAVWGEYIYLKDGKIFEAKILKDRKKSLVVKLPGGKRKTISRNKILRVGFVKIYPGRLFVMKNNGTTFSAYMVLEGEETYTFREKLYGPKEFTVRRDEVLFTTKMTPTGLEAVPKSTGAVLKWRPPYNEVTGYKIYVKEKDKKNFVPAGKAKKTAFTLTGLRAGQYYTVRVTALDKKGRESLACTPVTFFTKGPPLTPRNVRCRKIETKEGITARITWEGDSPEYRVLKGTPAGFTETARTKKNSWTARDLDSGEIHYFAVRAVDGKGNESALSKIVDTGRSIPIRASLGGLYHHSLGGFGDMYSRGMGAMARVTFSGLGLKSFTFGFEGGHRRFTGKEGSGFENMAMTPLFLTAQYEFAILENITLGPVIASGGAFDRVEYHSMSNGLKRSGTLEKSSFQPAVSGGLFARWDFYDRYFVSLQLRCGAILESTPLWSIEGGLGAGTRFDLKLK